jgi:hypothetical protein
VRRRNRPYYSRISCQPLCVARFPMARGISRRSLQVFHVIKTGTRKARGESAVLTATGIQANAGTKLAKYLKMKNVTSGGLGCRDQRTLRMLSHRFAMRAAKQDSRSLIYITAARRQPGERSVTTSHSSTILRFPYFMNVFLSHSPASQCGEAFLNQ